MTEEIVDLFSDTATQPTRGMREAMLDAPLGDEQRRTDPTVRKLEERIASLVGKDRAVLVPSATMANQIAIALHCSPGDEVICHRTAHVINSEGGGLAANSGVQVMALQGERGIFDADDLRGALRLDDPHQPKSAAVVVENTSNGGGGSIWPDAAFDGVVQVCREHGLPLHIDGARLFNAAVARGVAPARWGHHARSVQICFSKGLGCPFGAVLCVDADLEPRARRIKQRLGGALRQAGIVAGAMLYALDHHVDRLAEDHQRAARLASALGQFHAVEVVPVETNIIYMRYRRGSAAELAERLRERGVLVSQAGPDRIRACTHLGITDSALERAIAAFSDVLKHH
ncbi:MAG TPA: GntG family PLP-dependent aldolase [Polyangiaceae bacterium]|nr:GntG family PLP-dependent aldolase [Polyangiaceae bacterium]